MDKNKSFPANARKDLSNPENDMSEKNNKNPFPEEMDFKVASSTDCTGLLCNGYGTEDELEELNEMYDFMKKPIVNEEKEIKNIR